MILPKKVFVEVIQDLKIISFCILQVSPNDKCPSRRHRGETHKEKRGEAHKNRNQTYVTQAKKHLDPPKVGRGKERFSSRTLSGSTPLSTPWFWSSGLHNYKRINVSCSKPPSLRYYGGHRKLNRKYIPCIQSSFGGFKVSIWNKNCIV